MTGEQLFNLFVEHSTTAAEVARMSVKAVEQHVREMRASEPDDIPMSDREIARAILDYAKSA